MKKMVRNIGIVMAMATVLVGCGKANSNNSSSTTNNTKVENSANAAADTKDAKDTAEANENLANAIIKDFSLTDDEAKNNQYTYAPVELNKDGSQQVLVLLKGDAFSGSGGTTMVLYNEKDGNFTKAQDWTTVNAPVYVTNEESNGSKTLVFQAGGGGAKSEWKALQFNGKEYNTVSDAKTVNFDAKDAVQTLFEDNATYFNLK